MTTLEHIRAEARALPPDEREALLAVLDFDLCTEQAGDTGKADAAWVTEIGSRVAEIETGSVTLLAHDEFISVFDEARAKSGGNRRSA
jgi:hypothetical protein